MAGGDEHKRVIAVEAVGPVRHFHRYGVQRSSALDVEQSSVRLLNRSAAAVAETRGIATYCKKNGRLERISFRTSAVCTLVLLKLKLLHQNGMNRYKSNNT